jgi:hypothetical protein
VFLLQHLKRELQQRERPAPLVEAVRREIVHGLGGVAFLSPIRIISW